MKSLAFGCLMTLVVASVCWADVELQPETRANLGIQSEPVQVLDAPREWPAAASVIDASALVTSLTDLRAAEEAAETSHEEFQRADALYANDTNVARKTRDAARTQSLADSGKVATARSQVLAAWGASIATMSPSARRQLIDDLLSGRVTLARAEPLLPIRQGAMISRAELSDLRGAGRWNASVLGALPQNASPSFSGAFLLRVSASLTAGQPLQATLRETMPSGVKQPSVPSASIVRWHGAEWIYEESPANHFVRRAVRASSQTNGRVLIDGSIGNAARIVTVGARALLAAELNASSADEGAED